jgi:PAS domain S-box-containing protein
MVWSINPDGSLKFVNQFTLSFFGIDSEHLTEHHIVEFMHEEERASSMEAIITALREKKSYRIEHRLRNRDNEYRWFLSQGGPSFYPDGRLYGFVGSAIDIHDRKRFEEELRYQHQLTQTITENATGPLFMLDMEGFCTYLNPAAEKAFGYKLEDLRDKPLHNYIHYIHPDGSDFPLEDCRIGHAVFGIDDLKEHEDVFIARNGTFIPVKCSAKRIVKDKITIGVLLEARDITIEKRAAEALQESEARFRSMADNISQLAWMADETGSAFWYNQRWLEFAGISAVEMKAQGWHNMVHPDYATNVFEKFRRCVSEGEPWEDTFPLRNREGYFRWFLTRATPIADARGNVIRWFGTNTDITERKETEEAIKMMADNLEKIVVERTLALQRSNEDLQQFAHVASHDLKEPLRKIQTFSNRLTDEFGNAIGEKGAMYLDKITHATRRMFNMIDGVLSYSTINASSQKPSSVDLSEILRHIESDLEILIHEKSAKLNYGDLPAIEGAGVLIYQLFYNLINNSLKFSREGIPPIISVREEMPENAETICLVLEDNGIGFEQEYSEKIFHTFTRLNSKDKYEGTGLGLSLCKKIAELHGGSITAYGAKDKGATFAITLPRKVG